MIRKNLLKFSLLCLIAAPALSQAHMKDMMMKDAPMKDMPIPTISWEGYYLGVNIGGAFSRSNLRTSTVFDPTGLGYFSAADVTAINDIGSRRIDSNQVTGGVQGGYDYQIDNFVIGLETDFDSMSLDHSNTVTATYPDIASTFSIKQSVKTHWLFTIRPRLGYAFGNFLVYGTGGYALTDVTFRSTFTDTAFTAFDQGRIRRNLNGWAAGAGVEYQFTNNWSVKGEYLYMQFGNTTTNNANLVTGVAPTTVAFPTNVFTHRERLRVQTVNFAVNYRF